MNRYDRFPHPAKDCDINTKVASSIKQHKRQTKWSALVQQMATRLPDPKQRDPNVNNKQNEQTIKSVGNYMYNRSATEEWPVICMIREEGAKLKCFFKWALESAVFHK